MSLPQDISALTARQTLEAYRAKTLSPVEMLEDVLARIARYEPALNAFSLVDDAGARAAAKAAEARWMRGEPIGPADGIIATVKSNIGAAGWPLRRGSAALPSTPAPDDAPTVAHLRRAGCIFVGQTNMPEYGWIGVTHARLTGITRNPWHTARTPGGSSGGAAVAAALGLGHFHMGTDGAGSIRIPASFTGAFGIMPGVGRVPAFPASPFGVLARLGPLARCVEDGAMMLQIIAAADTRDPAHAAAPVPDFPQALSGGIRGLRIGFSATLGFVDKLDPAVRAACAAAAKRLTEFGAVVEDADPGFAREEAEKPLRTLWDAGCAFIVNSVPQASRAQMDPGLLRVAERGRQFSATDLLEALSARAALCETMRRYHERYDVLLSPTMPITAFEVGQELPASGHFGPEWFDWSPYTWPFNVTGQPGASVPVGLDGDGLPIGLQIIGRMREEATVLRVARAVELLQGFAPLGAPVVKQQRLGWLEIALASRPLGLHQPQHWRCPDDSPR